MPRGRRPRHHGLPRAAQVVFERAARRGARSRRGGVGSRLGHPRRPRLGRVRQGLRGVVDGLRAAAGARAAGRVVRDQGHARRRHGVVGDLAALRPRALDLTAAAREAGRRLALRLLDARRPLQSAPPRPLPLVRGLRRRLPAADEDGVLPRTPRRAPSHAGALRRAPPRPRQRRHSSRHQTREPAPPRLRRAQGLRLWPRADAPRERRAATRRRRVRGRVVSSFEETHAQTPADAARRDALVSSARAVVEGADVRARRRHVVLRLHPRGTPEHGGGVGAVLSRPVSPLPRRRVRHVARDEPKRRALDGPAGVHRARRRRARRSRRMGRARRHAFETRGRGRGARGYLGALSRRGAGRDRPAAEARDARPGAALRRRAVPRPRVRLLA
mmetsp:Transcript_29169/g.90227  ORF Transcript_29169/g.90227 Transcript_29169/m.90227 type:complete len:388 (+) Transcript_29169:312-1475(+)